MVALFDITKIHTFKNTENLLFKCDFCGLKFSRKAKRVKDKIPRGNKHQFCSSACSGKAILKGENKKCTNCNKTRYIPLNEIKKSKTGRFFCSQSCSATYNNTHKKHGNRRSKLEVWIETRFANDFPNLKVLYNNKDTINSELDIYFPDLKIAVELNGIFHYEPIYGKEQLLKIQKNDKRKLQACLENKIELIIIDVSKFSSFKFSKADVYYKIIKNIVYTKYKSHYSYKKPQKDLEKEFNNKLKSQKKLEKQNKFDLCPICNGLKLKHLKTCSKECGY